MSDFVSTLVRKNSLRKECSALSVAELEKVLSDLNDILETKKSADLAKQAEVAAKREAVEAIQKQMLEMGLDISDIGGVKTSEKRTVAAKYRLIDADGKPHEWSGRGRTPKVFQERFDNGAKKEDYLIQN